MKRSILNFILAGLLVVCSCFESKAQVDYTPSFLETLLGFDSNDNIGLYIGLGFGKDVGEYIVGVSIDSNSKYKKNDLMTITLTDNEQIELYYNPETGDFENTFDWNIINKLLHTNLSNYEVNGKFVVIGGESAEDLRDCVNGGDPRYKSLSESLNKEIPLSRLLCRPFGYYPRPGKNYTYKDVMHSADLLYHWKLQEWPDKKECGFEWPNLDGMKILGFPIRRIASRGPLDDYFIGFFYCEVAMYKRHKEPFLKSLMRYMKDNGWNVHYYNKDPMPTFYKDNVMVSVYFDPTVKGEVAILNINSQVFPSAEEVKARIEEGLG